MTADLANKKPFTSGIFVSSANAIANNGRNPTRITGLSIEDKLKSFMPCIEREIATAKPMMQNVISNDQADIIKCLDSNIISN